MKKKIIYGIIIDRSSSMCDLRDEMLLSINNRVSAIKKISKEKNQDAYVELVTFNDKVNRVIELEPYSDVRALGPDDYLIDGMTSLYDALGSTLERIELIFGNEIRKGECNVAIIVYTDGYENSSRLYTQPQIKKMLTLANNMEGVEVSIVGCDVETLTMAKEINFENKNMVRTSRKDFVKSMKVMDDYFLHDVEGGTFNLKESMKDFDLDKE